MQSRHISLTSVLLLAGCATTSSATNETAVEKKPEPVMEKMLIVNNVPFDLAACGPKSVELGELNDVVLTAALLSGRPMYAECLLDPKTRGAAAETKVSLKATVNDSGASFEVAGANLQPSGKSCIEGALKKLPLKALAKGAAAVSVEVPFTHGAGSPSVKWGENIASDVVGTVRASLVSWCECYGDVGINPPPYVSAALKLVPGKPADVKLKSGSDPIASSVSTCLEAKLEGATFPTVERELQVPYNFQFINTNANQESADASPEQQFFQLDAVRGGKEVDVAFAFGARKSGSAAYDALVTKYKAKPAPALVKELKEKCAAVVSLDDAWIESLSSLARTYGKTQALIGTLKAKDAAWEKAEGAVKERQTVTQTELTAAQEQRKNDLAACPKSR